MSKNVAWFVNRVIFFLLKDSNAAKSVVDHVLSTPRDTIILPFTDHPGPITSEILSRNFKTLTVCERDPDLCKEFDIYVSKQFPDKRIQIYRDDLFDLSYKTWNDEAQNRCASIVRDSIGPGAESLGNVIGDCRGNGQVKLLVPLLKSRYESGFLRALYYQICLRLGLCSNSWIQYYMLMSDRQHAYLDARPSEDMRIYRSCSVLCNTILNIKTLESYDLEKCFGISLRKLQNTSAINNGSYRKVHLVRMEPRHNVLQQMDPRAFIEFRFLVTQMMHKRTALVVTFLDRFFDDFRDDILDFGIRGSTRCGDLNREQYLKLFLYLKDREDYRNSIFLQAAARAEENVFSL